MSRVLVVFKGGTKSLVLVFLEQTVQGTPKEELRTENLRTTHLGIHTAKHLKQ